MCKRMVLGVSATSTERMRRSAPGWRHTGGHRPGAGRPKELSGDTERLVVTIEREQGAALDRWAEENGHKSRSHAVRALLDSLG